MKIFVLGAVVLLCVLVSVEADKGRRRERRRLRGRRCNCDSIMQKVTQMMDKKLQVFEQRLGKIPMDKDTGIQLTPTKLKMMGHRLDMLGKELQGTKALMQKQSIALQHTRQFLYNKREDFVSLNDKYAVLSKTVQNLTAVVGELENMLNGESVGPVVLTPAEPETFPRDCDEVYRSGGMRFAGDYYIMIQPTGARKPFKALCKTYNNSGWTVIQRRQDGSVDFYKNWKDYKKGFGTLETEFWLGNDNIHLLTGQGDTKLLVLMQSMDGKEYHATYEDFRVDNERNMYTLNVKGYSGNAGDSLTSQWKKHDGKPFSTYDRDNDGRNFDNCAEHYHGAWWFNTCYDSHLNGRYYKEGAHSNYFVRNGILWNGIHEYASLKKVSMMVTTVRNRNEHRNDV